MRPLYSQEKLECDWQHLQDLLKALQIFCLLVLNEEERPTRRLLGMPTLEEERRESSAWRANRRQLLVLPELGGSWPQELQENASEQDQALPRPGGLQGVNPSFTQ